MRLFFALPLPDEVRRALAALRRDDVGKARWVPPAQMHLTMRFLGEVDDEGAARVLERVEPASAAWPSVRIALRGLGLFGSAERPRVLFAAIDPVADVARIAADLEARVREAGLPPEERPFRAHVTLARIQRADRRALRRLLEDNARFSTAPFDVPELVLYRSVLTHEGAIHEPLRRLRLGGS